VEIEFKDNHIAKAVYGEQYHSQMTKKILNELSSLISYGYPLYPGNVQHAVTILKTDNSVNLKDIFLENKGSSLIEA